MSKSKVLRATPHDIYASLRCEADCTVGAIEPTAALTISSTVVVGDKLVRVGSDVVADRGELRVILARFDEKEMIEIELVPKAAVGANNGTTAASPSAGVESALASSVLHNGAACALAPRKHHLDDDEGNEVPAKPMGTEAVGTWSPAAKPQAGQEELVAFPQLDHGGSPAKAGAQEVEEQTLAPERTLRSVLGKALQQLPMGRCLIAVVDATVSPVAELELLATERQRAVTTVDFGVKLRNRVRKEDMRALFADALKQGKWFVVIRGSKSLSLLEALASMLEELWQNDLRDVHPDSRIVINTESHPHFPQFLTKQSKSLRVRAALASSTPMVESVGNSVSALRLMTDQSSRTSAASTSAGGTAKEPRRMVRIAATVDVVDIESRDVFRNEKPQARPQVNVAGTVKLQHTFSALPQDKFFGIGYAGNKERYAFCSSLGNVYIVDDSGSSLLSFHVHDAAVWDVSFRTEYSFVTGAEDGSAVFWEQDSQENNVLVPKVTLSAANDVYAVRHTNNGAAVAIGGVMPRLTIRNASSGDVTRAALPASLQAMCPIGPASIVGGGGDGSVFVVDCATAQVVATSSQHTKKAPAVAVAGDIVVSGSFDSTVRLWDTRASPDARSLHTMKFQHYVTGLDVDDNHLTACVGDNLYLWDVRNLSVVLGGFPQAWQGLSRAVKITKSTGTIVTASPDGVARFWSFGNN